jgi:NAD(P)H-dependent FMN reductase
MMQDTRCRATGIWHPVSCFDIFTTVKPIALLSLKKAMTMRENIRILAIAGSLRATSSNHAIVKEAASLAPAGVEVIIYEGLGNVPLFNDSNDAPEGVADLRRQLAAADGVLICTPEYAFGVPGVLKNAIDWTVSSGEFDNKPVAVIAAATGGDKALASLLLTFKALSANVAEQATLLISFVRSKLDERGKVKDAATQRAMQTVMEALVKTIQTNTAVL